MRLAAILGAALALLPVACGSSSQPGLVDWSPDLAAVTDLPAPDVSGEEDFAPIEDALPEDVPEVLDDSLDPGIDPGIEEPGKPDALSGDDGPGAESGDPGPGEEGNPGDDGIPEIADISVGEDMADIAPETGPCTSATCIQCRPCVGDTDCNPSGGKANRCIEQGPEGRFCTVPCAGPADCPEGDDCLGAGGGAGICRPPEGCPCDGSTGAYPTVCFTQNEWGRCESDRRCGDPCGAAVPAPESCNGIDDDCNGQTDEDLGATTCGIGACAATVENCSAGKPVACEPASPGIEVCNGLDDDCDGQTDEELGATECGIGACATAVLNCVDGESKTCEPFPPQAEACNGLDDDCDGFTDEDLGVTSCGVGACAAKTDNCVGGQLATCVPLPPSVEACNGVDDDCDGATDEDLPALTCGIGACAASVPACVNGVPQTCVPGTPVAEACNLKDDDCDGQTDELGVITCGTGICLRQVTACVNGVVQACVPGKPANETCNGLDDNCDGQTDESNVCGCPAETWGGHVYLFCQHIFLWQTARDYCHNRGYHLVTLNSAEENTWLAQRAAAWNAAWYYSSAWWIGFTDQANEGSFAWEDGEPVTFTAWHTGEPNDWGGGEDCATTLQWGDATWNDAGCYGANRFACER